MDAASPHDRIVLLGPQRHEPTIAETFDRLALEGSVATVTAGWQEREAEVEELREHVDRPVVNLLLHAHAEELFDRDPDLAAAYRDRQETLKELQRLYRLRLSHTLAAAKQLFAMQSTPEALIPERRAAIRAVRRLDSHHLRRIRAAHTEFAQAVEPEARPVLTELRARLRDQLASVSALAIAGGHVAVLLNRLRLFGVIELLPRIPIVAWSAGAMVLGKRVVLFHDSPPQGAGDAEVLEAGLGLFDDLLPLPHATRRLRLDDPHRVALFARRFSPARCVTLDSQQGFEREDGDWRAFGGPSRLGSRGRLRRVKEGATP